jgi:GTPase SAR1 family protein
VTAELEPAFARLHEWARQAQQGGWLSGADVQEMGRIERQNADELFAAGKPRPLLVGLFGGTGVGKSSLLNRLAGENIARVGAERPTSREVTLYLHQDHALESLPPEFPLARTRIQYHHDRQRRDIAWIDMPDIDSTHRANRELVFAWLPYIDWLIYVVSPERYRDDAGWKVLRERGHRHEWLFVINHWDTAEPEQYDAFVSDLAGAGIDRPRVLRTSCTIDCEEDEFARLEELIRNAIEQHGLEELKRLGILAKLRDLAQLRDDFRSRLGSEEAWQTVCGRIRERSGNILSRLRQSLAWSFALISGRFPEPRRGWRDKGGMRQRNIPAADELRAAIWGPQADSYVADVVNEAVVAAAENGVPAEPVERAVGVMARQVPGLVTEISLSRLRQALLKPGPAWQRALFRLTGALRRVLPAAAAAWAVYHLVTRFHAGTTGRGELLGLDFAVHSFVLISCAWLLPYLMHRLSKPSLRKAARRGLEQGAAAAIQQSEQELASVLEKLGEERRQLLLQLKD